MEIIDLEIDTEAQQIKKAKYIVKSKDEELYEEVNSVHFQQYKSIVGEILSEVFLHDYFQFLLQ